MFLPDGHARTFGEMPSEEKHGLPPRGKGLSHRARAFLKLAEACLPFPPPLAGEVGAHSAPGGGKS
jgi:inosine/xanthosine triphosphate pyrophosphatase family protein